jgi:hypothetical protein
MDERGLQEALEKMRAAGLSGPAMESFRRAWQLAAAGGAGLIPEDTLAPASLKGFGS